MQLRCATFNVLADAYLDHADYSHVAPELLQPRARIPYLVRTITDLNADIIGLQEVEVGLADALVGSKRWRVFWTPKDGEKPDGCLLLVRRGIDIADFTATSYGDGTCHVLQQVNVYGVTVANTHIKWDMPYRQRQAERLLAEISEEPAVILADSNDRPGEIVHGLIARAGFRNVWGNEPTALVGSERAPIDLLAVRGVRARRIGTLQPLDGIPSVRCPSDHIPVMASVTINETP